MDPLTHALVGGLAAKTAGASNRRFWIMVLLGSAPDLDVIFNGLGGWAFMLQHRGLTHSILGVALQAVFYAWVLGRWDKGLFQTRAFLYSIPLAFHLVGDYLTCYGVPLWAPFSFRGYSADLVHSVNLIPMTVMGFGLVWLSRNKLHGWRETRVLWATWALYLAITLTGKTYAAKLTEMPGREMSMIPGIVNPFSWHGIYVDKDSKVYHSYAVNLFEGKSEAYRVFSMPNGDLPVQASMKSREVQTFLRENRWPVVRFTRLEDRWHVEWGNVLFSSRGLVRGKVAVEVSPTGDILDERKTLSFWDPA